MGAGASAALGSVVGRSDARRGAKVDGAAFRVRKERYMVSRERTEGRYTGSLRGCMYT